MTEIEVLEKLKEQLIHINSDLNEENFSPSEMIEKHPEQAPFYLKKATDNLYKGFTHDKLDRRANAIKSSAAMIFNTLGTTDFFLDGRKYTQIKYEEELKAIKSDAREHNAHLDAVFISEDGKTITFVESKMLEWFSSPKNLARAYLNKEQYFPETENASKIFINFFKSLLLSPEKEDVKGRLFGAFRKYDAVQMTIHILGIYNFYKSNQNFEKIRLMNIVWDNKQCPQYKDEAEQAERYLEKVRDVLYPLFDGKFEVEYIPYSKFYESISFSDKERKNYLRRYILKGV